MNIQDQRLHYMALAQCVSAFSDDTTKVGCLIVSESGKEVLSCGHNRFPEGVDTQPAERHERPAKYKYTEHAERTAIYFAAKHGVRLEDSTMYLTYYPCSDCARAIIMSGIQELVCKTPNLEDPTWGAEFALAQEMLREAGVAVVYVEEVK